MRSFPLIAIFLMVLGVIILIAFQPSRKVSVSCPSVEPEPYCVAYVEVPAMFDEKFTGTKLTARREVSKLESDDGLAAYLYVTLGYRSTSTDRNNVDREQKYFRKTNLSDKAGVANVRMVCAKSRDGQRVYACADVN